MALIFPVWGGMVNPFVMGLVHNVSLLFSIILVLDLLLSRLKKSGRYVSEIIVGITLGFVVIALMNTSWELVPGVVFDTRSVLLSVSGMFFGIIPTTIAVCFATLYRISLGGAGIYMGVSVILESALVGLIWRKFREKVLCSISLGELYFFGLTNHLLMLVLIFILPGGIKAEVFSKMWLPLITIYPLATLLLGVLLSRRLKQDLLTNELKESEEKYKFLFDNMSLGVNIQDVNGKIIEANSASAKILGLTKDQLWGKTPYDSRWKMIKEDGSDLDPVDVPSNIALRTGKPVENVCLGIHIPEKDEYHWLLVSSVIRYKNIGGNNVLTLTSFSDITLQKNTEKLLIESEYFFRESQRAAYIGSYKADFINNIWESSDILDEIFGIDRSFTKTVPSWLSLIHPDDQAMMSTYLQEEVIGSHRPFNKEYRILRKSDNQTRWVLGLGNTRTNSDGKVSEMIGTIQDITERKIAEERLERANSEVLSQKQKMEAILHDMGDAVFVTDNQKKIIMSNKAMEKLFGMTELELIGKNIEEAIAFSYESSGEKPTDLIRTVFEEKKPAKPAEVLVLNKKDGAKLLIDGIASPIVNKEELSVGTVWVLRDVTKEREIDKMKTDFISLASHQLRTPLTGIRWFVEILEENAAKIPIEKIEEYIRKIGVSNNRLIALVNDMLSASRVDSGKLVNDISTHSLRELLEQSIDQQGRIFVDKNIEILGLDIIPIEYESEVDLVQLTQVFGNLFNNAASYSPAGSKIEVKAEPHDGKITVSIKDQGLGIPKPQQEKMFTKFFRGDNVSKTIPGSGLGLYVAKSIVENHGGKIWFESAENLGTTFFVELPLKQSDHSV